MEKLVNLQFPKNFVDDNELEDGQVHQVNIRSLEQFKLLDRDFYVAFYYNEKQSGLILLTKINNEFVNVLLDDYGFLIRFNGKNGENFKKIDISNISFPETIKLTERINSEQLFSSNPELVFNEFVPLDSFGGKNRVGVSFKFEDFINNDGIDIYYFTKALSYKEKENKIKEGLNNEILANDIIKHQFETDVKEGEYGSIFSINKNGEVAIEKTLLFPGKRKYNITYVPCDNYIDFELINYSYFIRSDVKRPNYGNYEEIFRKICCNKMDTSCFGCDSNELEIPESNIKSK